ncbi:hypothetical protein MBLNU230_g8386t1 [Neophaeotheca triangularis]
MQLESRRKTEQRIRNNSCVIGAKGIAITAKFSIESYRNSWATLVPNHRLSSQRPDISKSYDTNALALPSEFSPGPLLVHPQTAPEPRHQRLPLAPTSNNPTVPQARIIQDRNGRVIAVPIREAPRLRQVRNDLENYMDATHGMSEQETRIYISGRPNIQTRINQVRSAGSRSNLTKQSYKRLGCQTPSTS